MNGILYTLAVILLVCWAFGFFVHAMGAVIHLLLILGILFIVFPLLRRGG